VALHPGFCRGPVDELVQINVGGKEAFGPKEPARATHANGKWGIGVSGSRVYSPFSGGRFYIRKPNLFGGEKKEGGIDGQFHFLTGEKTQVVPAGLKSLLGGLVPEFRGVCTAWYDGLISSMTPYGAFAPCAQGLGQ